MNLPSRVKEAKCEGRRSYGNDDESAIIEWREEKMPDPKPHLEKREKKGKKNCRFKMTRNESFGMTTGWLLYYVNTHKKKR